MSDYVIEVEILEPVEDAGVGAIGVFLDVEDRTEMVHAAGRVDDEVAGLVGKNVPADRQVVMHWRRQYGYRLISMVQQVTEELEQFREHHAIAGFVHAEAIWRIILEYRFDVTRKFL